MTVEIVSRGLEELRDYFERLPSVAQQASVLAVNRGAQFGSTLARRETRDQVNFSASYLNAEASDGRPRLGIVKRARGDDVEAVIRGRERPTSLARFVVGSRALGRRTSGRPVRVKVKSGGSTVGMPSAWLVRLRAGKRLDDEVFNVGLAIRLKPGVRINKKQFGVQSFGRNVYLLYGPSVAQVFRSVARDLSDPVSDVVVEEFVRQFERLSK